MDEARWARATWTELARDGEALAPDASPAPALSGASPASEPRRPGQPGRRLRPRVAALLPVGAVEAHGPHLPLDTDVVIACAAADAALPGLRRLGLHPMVLPPLAFTAAPFAAAFPGTISVRPATVSALVRDVAASLERQGAELLILANAHLDPAHLAALHDAARAQTDASRRARTMPIVFPDVTRKPWAPRLTPEFRSGACHAGRYETSVVMASAPDLVRHEARRRLPPHPVSLSEAARVGAATFDEAGVPDAYCGDPAAATSDEGRATIEALGRIIVDATAQVLDAEAALDAQADRTDRTDP